MNRMLRLLTAGESHGKALVGVLEGLPAGVPISFKEIAQELARRRHGHGRSGRQKLEADRFEILSGVRHGRTLFEHTSGCGGARGSDRAKTAVNRRFVVLDR